MVTRRRGGGCSERLCNRRAPKPPSENFPQLARDHVVAVLCFEADVERCHRKVIIDQVVKDTATPVADLPAYESLRG
jgi:hypothetical protein